MSAPETDTIRTPDQRLRVFVSSTLQELADERRAARAAITQLRLAPVMFELGARPHPPQDLYRAYLDQSDIFVGIYWQKYGWVAPDLVAPTIAQTLGLRESLGSRSIFVDVQSFLHDKRLLLVLDNFEQIDAGAFDAAWQAGRALKLDRAVAYALER